jgi:F-type H+-transporting ATPase subunit delta
MTLLAQRYARALFEVAASADALDEVGADLQRLASALADPVVQAAILSPDTRAEARRAVLQRLLGEAAHTLSKNLVGVVLRRRREKVLAELSAAFQALLRESRGEALGLLETARPLDEAGVKALEARASELCGQQVTLEVQVDPDLIGGVRIRVGNTLYDGSVATAIADLQRRLMDAPL